MIALIILLVVPILIVIGLLVIGYVFCITELKGKKPYDDRPVNWKEWK